MFESGVVVNASCGGVSYRVEVNANVAIIHTNGLLLGRAEWTGQQLVSSSCVIPSEACRELASEISHALASMLPYLYAA